MLDYDKIPLVNGKVYNDLGDEDWLKLAGNVFRYLKNDGISDCTSDKKEL